MCLDKRININNKETLGELFKLYEEEIYENTETNKKLIDKIVKAEDVFYRQLTQEQIKEYENICDLKQSNYDETDKSIFAYAFSLAVRLMSECIY